MVFWNLNNLLVIVFVILLLSWWLLLWWIFKRDKKKINVILLFCSFFFILINIFEIKWSFINETETVDWWKIVFAIDVSKSMNTEDIKSSRWFNSRLDSVKELINSYITDYRNNEYWLIVFAWEALEVLPFTSDIWTYKTVLYWINNWNVSKYWTNLNSVFESLNNYFPENGEWGLAVIFTDWWDEEIDISKDLINSLIDKWVKLVLVWTATESWWNIPIWTDFFWRKIYKKYNWEYVVSKLNKRILKSLRSKWDIGYTEVSNNDSIEKTINYISDNINLVNLEKNINYRFDFTRVFIFISFCFFVLYLFISNFSWRKK